ncbi:hypothetical protein E2C01_037061 [Portunus trituberculatus]|uniref:Uncharacterized protein n=1 Tax=Portunus trituberculatus TaxID=210409 RepID=A0A5B7FG27_PORTR|nr:hypothetical protein [Portunus trituberculatus]
MNSGTRLDISEHSSLTSTCSKTREDTCTSSSQTCFHILAKLFSLLKFRPDPPSTAPVRPGPPLIPEHVSCRS